MTMPPPPAPRVPPEAPGNPAKSDPTTAALTELRGEVAVLGDMFRRRLLAAKDTRQALDLLQSELDRQRDAAAAQTIRPLLYDVALVIDRINRELGDPSSEPLAASVRTELAGLLEKFGAVRMAHLPTFDATRHEAIRSVTTDDPELIGQICEVLRDGYELDGRVIRTQQVVVYAGARP